MTCIPSRGMFAPLSSLGLAVHLRGKCSSLDPHLCSPVPAAGGIAAGQLFLRRLSRGHALRIATLNTRREPLEAFVFWAILTAADQDVRAALLIPVVTGAGGYVAGEL